ncbi:MAG: acetyltransferase [Steroidobacter sp.]
MTTLLIVGAGGHGRVVADAALTMSLWRSVCFVDDAAAPLSVLGFPVVGRSADLERLASSYKAVVIGIGEASARLKLLERCAALGYELPVVVHASASISRFASIGRGSVVFAQAAVNVGTALGQGCIVNTGATVDHDCELEEGVHVCPGVHLAGSVRIAARSWIGIGSAVRQGIRIGSDVTVGAGAAVVSDIESSVTVMGVPARTKRGDR